ncbi:MAG: type IV toxin-antitoxin system AbiEi family antitoxin [Thermoplasmata archaeon]|nr:type IV toxin-antitoxin system AbiEi family antitoxin [Thermoplasmata archaeon]
MRIADEVYASLLEKRVVNSEEMGQYSRKRFGTGYGYFHKQYVQPFLKAGKLLRVKRGLYVAVNVFGGPEPDRYLIAGKLRPEYYLGYHTALELHGCAYSAFGSCQVAVRRDAYFRPFGFGGVRYVPVVHKDLKTGAVQVERSGHRLWVSNPSRTLVDCLRRIDLSGGLEECLKSLDGLRGVRFRGVEAALDVYGEDILRRKTGYVLELMRNNSPYYGGLKDSELDRVASKIGKNPLYMEPGAKSVRSERWNLYVPQNIEGMMRGV